MPSRLWGFRGRSWKLSILMSSEATPKPGSRMGSRTWRWGTRSASRLVMRIWAWTKSRGIWAWILRRLPFNWRWETTTSHRRRCTPFATRRRSARRWRGRKVLTPMLSQRIRRQRFLSEKLGKAFYKGNPVQLSRRSTWKKFPAVILTRQLLTPAPWSGPNHLVLRSTSLLKCRENPNSRRRNSLRMPSTRPFKICSATWILALKRLRDSTTKNIRSKRNLWEWVINSGRSSTKRRWTKISCHQCFHRFPANHNLSAAFSERSTLLTTMRNRRRPPHWRYMLRAVQSRGSHQANSWGWPNQWKEKSKRWRNGQVSSSLIHQISITCSTRDWHQRH